MIKALLFFFFFGGNFYFFHESNVKTCLKKFINNYLKMQLVNMTSLKKNDTFTRQIFISCY